MKLSFYILIAIASFSTILLSSCENETNTNTDVLTGNFYVRYLEKGKTERIEAHLFLVDSTKNKKAFALPSGIFQDETKMSSKWISDKLHRYQIEKQSNFRKEVNFEFTDQNGNLLKNSISMNPISNLELPDEIDLKELLPLDFSSEPILANEKISILMNNESGETKVISILGPKNEIELVDLNKNGISPGQWIYYFVKRHENKSEGPDIFLHNTYEYYTTDKQLIIK